jgi:hypothetical protein
VSGSCLIRQGLKRCWKRDRAADGRHEGRQVELSALEIGSLSSDARHRGAPILRQAPHYLFGARGAETMDISAVAARQAQLDLHAYSFHQIERVRLRVSDHSSSRDP